MLAALEFFQHCPVRRAPFYGRVKVVSLRDLHHAQTFRFPLVGPAAGHFLGAPSSALTFAHPERALNRAAPAITRHEVE
jgi:hypothetical protein